MWGKNGEWINGLRIRVKYQASVSSEMTHKK